MPAVLWEFSRGGAERCLLETRPAGFRLRGTALLVHEGAPAEVRYAVTTDHRLRTEDVDVLVERAGAEPRRLVELANLFATPERPPEFADCLDIDLGFTPATNTLPIRRLGLAVGESREIAVAWLLWPELTIERSTQRYERLAPDRYRYSSGDFAAELTVDESGLVLEYEGLWRAVARA